MNNKERVSQGGGENIEWEKSAKILKFDPEAARARAERAVESRAEYKAEKPVAKKRGEVAEPEKSIEQQFKIVEKENKDIVHPKTVEFLAGKEPKLPEGEDLKDYLVYPISSERRVAVRKELAGQSFEDQAYKASTPEEWRVANLLAMEIESNKDTDPEVLARLKEYKEDPASGYMEKKAYFTLINTENAIKRDEATLKLAKEQYEEARGGKGLKAAFRRFLNRRDIKQKKERMEWTKARIDNAEGKLNAQRMALVEATAAKRAAQGEDVLAEKEAKITQSPAEAVLASEKKAA